MLEVGELSNKILMNRPTFKNITVEITIKTHHKIEFSKKQKYLSRNLPAPANIDPPKPSQTPFLRYPPPPKLTISHIPIYQIPHPEVPLSVQKSQRNFYDTHHLKPTPAGTIDPR